MAIDAFQTRVLLAAVNARDENGNMLISAPDETFLTRYFGSPEETESETFDIIRTTGSRRMAQFRASQAPANVVKQGDTEALSTYHYPIIREKIPVTPIDLQKMYSVQQLYRTNTETLEARQNRVVAGYLKTLKERVVRREKWMAFQLLTTGAVQYANDNVAFRVDFGIDVAYLPVLSGTSRWGQSEADIAGNLSTWTTAINTATGGYGGDVFLGSTAAALFMADPTIKAQLNNLNYRAGSLTLNANSLELGNYNGFTFHRYSEAYKDDDGNTAQFMPATGVLMFGNTFKGRRPFGLNEELVDAGLRPASAYFSKSWIAEDPSARWLLMASRPLPVVEEEGSWVFATVA
jgi:hypothetical protein